MLEDLFRVFLLMVVHYIYLVVVLISKNIVVLLTLRVAGLFCSWFTADQNDLIC